VVLFAVLFAGLRVVRVVLFAAFLLLIANADPPPLAHVEGRPVSSPVNRLKGTFAAEHGSWRAMDASVIAAAGECVRRRRRQKKARLASGHSACGDLLVAAPRTFKKRVIHIS